MPAPVQRFLISAVKSGIQRDKDAWLIMDDAWETLQNVHVWRERIVKRFGAKEMNSSVSYDTRQLFTRLRLLVGTTDINGDLTVAGAAFPVITMAIGMMFSAGTEIYTLNALGAAVILLSTGGGVFTMNTATRDFTLVGGPALTAVYFYPALPVMALPSYENAAINAETLVAFDTKFVYTFTFATGWLSFGPVPPAANSGIWTGTNADFHSIANYRGASGSEYLLFVVNGVVADVVQYYNAATNLWVRLVPVYDSTTGFVIRTAKVVVPFHDRLLLINTTEQTAAGNRNFPNRIRFSQNGDPTIAATSWDEIVIGRGGYLEIPTREAIISVVPIKDSLILYCERSTWALEYSGNEVLPFRYRQINAELGVESSNSTMLFDKAVIGMGSTGIHACNGMNVDRIDDDIPDNVFDIINSNNGPQRVNAIRDYWTQEVYWSYTSSQQSSAFSLIFPNRVLVFNYKTGSWAFNDDSITAFGYYQKDVNITWADMTDTWANGDEQWADPSDISLFRDVVAGNQEGFTFIVDKESSTNSIGLSITDLSIAANIITLTVIDHNLKSDDVIYINNLEGTVGLNDNNYIVQGILDKDNFQILQPGTAGAYEGGGTIVRVSRILLQSKQYNFFNEVGKKVQIPRIDFLVDTIEDGKIQLNYLSSFSDQSLNQAGDITGSSLGTNILDLQSLTTFTQTSTKIWRSMFPQLEGEVIQYSMTMTDPLMLDKDTATAAFRLHAVLFYARQTNDFGL